MHDPLGRTPSFAIDREFEPLLDLLDGTRTIEQMRQSLLMRRGLDLEIEDLREFIGELGQNGWLEGVHANDGPEVGRSCGSSQAGVLYPKDPEALRACLRSIAGGPELRGGKKTCGVLLPHHPFEVAPSTWRHALRSLPAARDLDLIVVVSTDFAHQEPPLVWLDEDMESVFGPLPAARAVLHRLGECSPNLRSGPGRSARSPGFELALQALHFAYGDAVPPILPLLCGRLRGDALPQADQGEFGRAISTLCVALNGLRVLFVASAELRHEGLLFSGRETPQQGRVEAEERDRACLNGLATNNLRHFLRGIRNAAGELEVSGALTLFALMHLLPLDYYGDAPTYEQVSLPEAPQDWSGVAAMSFYA
jgi:AmmeMemoRadiSam system protein B